MWYYGETKKVIYKEKQNQMILSIDKEINNLKNKKQLLLAETEKLYNLTNRKETLQMINYINRNDSFKVIAYLVSQIEGITYHYTNTKIILYATPTYRFLHYTSPISYKLAYLVQDGEEDVASEEINKRFKLKRSNNDTTENFNYYSIEKQLKIPSDSYIQLTCLTKKGLELQHDSLSI